jgi:hypothetical protein
MGSEMQPEIMRQQKSEQILILKFGFSHVHKKFNCGNATHFLFLFLQRSPIGIKIKKNFRFYFQNLRIFI